MMVVRFHGVRGSHPTACAEMCRYGGSTACVEVVKPNRAGKKVPIILDMGTGAVKLGNYMTAAIPAGEYSASFVVLLSHLHPDHREGYPFFKPAYASTNTIYCAGHEAMMNGKLMPPDFPVDDAALKAKKNFIPAKDGATYYVTDGGALVTAAKDAGDINNPPLFEIKMFLSPPEMHQKFGSFYYRIRDLADNRSVVCAWDIESVGDALPRFIEFARGADIIIHDTTYTDDEYASTERPVRGFGHSTYSMAMNNARAAGCPILVPFHYDTGHTDVFLDNLKKNLSARSRTPLLVFAEEGLSLTLGKNNSISPARFLSTFAPVAVKKAPSNFTIVSYKKDQYITLEGKPTDRFFIIQEGQVLVHKQFEVIKKGGATLGPGDYFGVISSMSGYPQVETSQATTDAKLIMILRDEFEKVIHDTPAVAQHLLQHISAQMRFLNNALAALTLRNVGSSGDAQLYETAKYFEKAGNEEAQRYCLESYAKNYPAGEFMSAVKSDLDMFKIGADEKLAAPALSPDGTPFFKEGGIIFAEGEPGDTLYIIQNGTVKITRIINGSEMIIAVLRRGDIFGEMAILESKPRSANAIAGEECVLEEVKRETFAKIAADKSDLVVKITELLASRLWLMDKQLVNATLKDPEWRIIDYLVMNLERNRIDPNLDAPYIFDFGAEELAKLIGMNDQCSQALRKLTSKNVLAITKGKVTTPNVSSVFKELSIMRRIQKFRP